MDHSADIAKPATDLHTPDPAVVKEIKGSVKKYLGVLGVLAVGTVLTVAVAPIDFGGHSINVAVGLIIATFKASCVALIFMHLSHERRLIYKVLLFTGILLAAMLFLFVLALLDPIHFSSYPKTPH